MGIEDLFTVDRLQVPDYTKDLWKPPEVQLSSGLSWHGVIIGRAWHKDFTEEDYLLMLAGGKKRRRHNPDTLTQDGAPVFYLSDLDRKQVEKTLDRHCLGMVYAENVACSAGRNIILQFINNVGSLTGVQYFAVGTGVGTPASGDTQLFSEFFRKAITGTSISGGQTNISTFFSTSEGNTTYTEAGLFGDGATGTANSGTLFAHASYAYTKTNSINLTNNYFVTLS